MENTKLSSKPGEAHIRADFGTNIAKDTNNSNQDCDFTSQWNLDHTLTGKLSGMHVSEQRRLSGVSEGSGQQVRQLWGQSPRFPEQKVSLSPYYSQNATDNQSIYMPQIVRSRMELNKGRLQDTTLSGPLR